MTTDDVQRKRQALKRRVAELLRRDLPPGWQCVEEGEKLALRREHDGLSRILALEQLYRRVEQDPMSRRQSLYSFVAGVLTGVRELGASRNLSGSEDRVYPVVRHASFIQSEAGRRWVTRPHTAETVIAYALDCGDSYILIDRKMLEQAGWTEDDLHRHAMRNLAGLPVPVRTQQVGAHRIHFISPNDGYAASRVLLMDLLERYANGKTGTSLGVAVPHQDVLIIADLADESGAQLLSRLTADFAAKGDVPISPLPFFYENQTLEPFVVVQHASRRRRPAKRKG